MAKGSVTTATAAIEANKRMTEITLEKGEENNECLSEMRDALPLAQQMCYIYMVNNIAVVYAVQLLFRLGSIV
jgi:hypothetical protein